MIQVKVTVPKEILNQIAVEKALERVLDEAVRDVYDMFSGTVEGWSTTPRGLFKSGSFGPVVFNKRVTLGVRVLKAEVFTYSKKYALVNGGAKSHPITARRTPTLRFQRGYNASTRPGELISKASSRFGDWWTPRTVNHPGFEARKFDETIAERYGPVFEKDVQDAIDRAAR